MLRDVTIGQYYPAESVLHKLDPRVKLVFTIGYVISLFLVDDWIGYGIAALALALAVMISKVPFSYIVRGLKPIIWLILFTTLMNLFWTPGKAVWQWGLVKITQEGLLKSVYMAIRLFLLIIGSSLMTLTTTPNQLTDGLEKLMKPLAKVKVPVHDIALMMSIALRFIPILTEESDKIRKAQMARGAEFEKGNILKRANQLLSLLVPLFVSASRRAMELAMAMESRCYHGGEGRTKMKPLHYKKMDYAAYMIGVFYLGIIIWLA